MSDINFLKLYADASGLKIRVMANRLACKTDRERALHDWTVEQLRRFIAFTRHALAAERSLLLNTDPAKAADLAEDVFNCIQNYREFWCEEDGCDLWDIVPPKMEVLRTDLRDIHRNLKIHLSYSGLALPRFKSRQRSADC